MKTDTKERGAVAAAARKGDTAEPWFMSRRGIMGRYAEMRETEAQRHVQRMKDLNDEELAFLDAFEARMQGNS